MEGAYLVGVVIWGIIWGVVAKAIVKNKGYEEEGTKYFWLGFFFSFIPAIIAATKPNRNYQPTPVQPTSLPYEELEKLAKLKEQGVLTEEEYNKLRGKLIEKL